MKSIPLNKGLFATVDDEDFDRLTQHKWFAHKVVNTFYAERYVGPKFSRRCIKMHAEIITIPKGLQCDHIDGNGLNNQKLNLRAVTIRRNQQNRHVKKSSKYPGVYKQKRDGKWRAHITFNGTVRHLGLFEVEEDAYTAYRVAEAVLTNGAKS